MGSEAPNDIDRAEIEAHAQRTVEQTALRKVRKALDDIEHTEAVRRRTLRYALIACALLALFGVLYFGGLIFGDRGAPKSPPMKVPSTLPQR